MLTKGIFQAKTFPFIALPQKHPATVSIYSFVVLGKSLSLFVPLCPLLKTGGDGDSLVVKVPFLHNLWNCVEGEIVEKNAGNK